MNVLIFVMTMLMLLAAMTYARLDAYRGSRTFQIVYEDYMQNVERGMINSRAEKVYKSIDLESKETGNKSPKSQAISRIGIKLFVDEVGRSKAGVWDQTKILFKNLIEVLYKDQPFYQDLEASRPDFVDEIINELVRTIDGLPNELKPKSAAGLANIKLEDAQLDKALYLMLRGAPFKIIAPEQQSNQGNPGNPPVVEEVEPDTTASADQKEEEAELQEHVSPKGYYSLLDFVTLSSTPKIRVYLAPPPVLQAIFIDPATVNAILEERYSLYKQAKDGTDVKELGTRFKNQFERLKDSRINDDSLDFSVSKTRPN